MRREYFELRPEHVHKPFIRAFGRTWAVSDFMGTVRPEDVGKRVYLVGGILQVENDAQRDRRLGRSVREAGGEPQSTTAYYAIDRKISLIQEKLLDEIGRGTIDEDYGYKALYRLDQSRASLAEGAKRIRMGWR